MQLTLVIFSGLPGSGKSTLAERLARELCWPLLRIDDVAGNVPPDADFHFWDEKILVLLNIAEAQLELGLSVIVDSVFMEPIGSTPRRLPKNTWQFSARCIVMCLMSCSGKDA